MIIHCYSCFIMKLPKLNRYIDHLELFPITIISCYSCALPSTFKFTRCRCCTSLNCHDWFSLESSSFRQCHANHAAVMILLYIYINSHEKNMRSLSKNVYQINFILKSRVPLNDLSKNIIWKIKNSVIFSCKSTSVDSVCSYIKCNVYTTLYSLYPCDLITFY